MKNPNEYLDLSFDTQSYNPFNFLIYNKYIIFIKIKTRYYNFF